MTTKPKATAKPRPGPAKAAKTAPARPAPAKRSSSGRGALIALAIGAVVVIAAVIAFVATRSDDASAGPQVFPVQVSGTPLAQFPQDQGAADPAVGQTPPTLSGQSLFDGTPLKITPGEAPQLIVFVAHWCPHCQREVPVLVKWMNSPQKPADLQVTAVSTAYNASPINAPASAWLQREKWPTPVMADSSNNDAAQAYGLTSYPYLVLVGSDGKVKARTSGEMTADQITQFVNGGLGR